MPKHLTHAFISKPLESGRYFDTTRGLHLYVKPNKTKFWVYRFTFCGKRHDMGLGPYPEVSLSSVRLKAQEARFQAMNGVNPVIKGKSLIETPSMSPKFSDFAEEYIRVNSVQWRNPKHTAQWRSTMRDYAYPIIGELRIDAINTEHILAILNPIWANKTETASRLRGRMERIISAAISRGLRAGPNPASWRSHLENILPKPKKIQRVKHHAALPYSQIKGVIEQLRKKDCMSALSLEFLILTAARTGEVRFATWNEIEEDVWVIPAERMKAGKEHRVPLTERCMDILKISKSVFGESKYIFHTKGHPISNVAMASLLGRIAPNFTVHGFRSTFRDWVAEETLHSGEVAEMALAHQIQNRVEASYRRGNLLSRRRTLMQDWANYCDSSESINVISINLRSGTYDQ